MCVVQEVCLERLSLARVGGFFALASSAGASCGGDAQESSVEKEVYA